MLNLEDARKEIENKSYNQIQQETAWRWASRAAAMFEKTQTGISELKALYLSAANSFFSEAVEHAAEVSPKLVQEVMDAVEPYQKAADDHVCELLKGK